MYDIDICIVEIKSFHLTLKTCNLLIEPVGYRFSRYLWVYIYMQFFSLSLTKESKYSEILLNKNNKCLFSQVYTSKYIPINLPVKPILGADIDLFNLKSYINKAYYINILMWNLK